MLKRKEYHICDRCKKEIKEKDINHVAYTYHFYELCDKCNILFEEFDNKVIKIKKQWEELEKDFKFGEYLPKEVEKIDD